MKEEFILETSVKRIFVNMFIILLYLIIPTMAFMALVLRVGNELFYYFPLIIVSAILLLYLSFFVVELIWLITQKPICKVTEEGILIYHLTKEEFHPWEGVRRYKFKTDKFGLSGRMLEFYDRAGKVLFTLNVSRSQWHKTKVKEQFSAYKRNSNNNNQPWS